jgi:hypothetical protein
MTDWNEKMTVGQSRSEEASKRSTGLESAGSQKERKREANCKRTVFGEAGKCGKTWSEVESLAGNRVTWLVTE